MTAITSPTSYDETDDDHDHEYDYEYDYADDVEETKNVHIKSIWKTSAPVLVQSSALQTFSFEAATVERVQVLLKKGRQHGPRTRRYPQNPIQAQIDLWHGPDCSPQKLALYFEDDDDDDDDDDEYDLAFGRRTGDEDDEEEDDDTTNFSAIIETPQGHNTIAVRNGASNFDLLACVEGEEIKDSNNHPRGSPAEYFNDPYGRPYSNPAASVNHKKDGTMNSSPLQSVIERLMATATPQLVEGCDARKKNDVGESHSRSDVHTVPLASNVASVQVLLRTEYTRPLQARVELILKEHPSNGKKPSAGRVLKRTIVEVYSEDGMERPFFAVLETPKKRNRNRNRRRQRGGKHNNHRPKDHTKKYSVSMRVVNLSGPEFPLLSSVEPYIIDTNIPDDVDDPSSFVGEDNEESQGIGDGDDNTDHAIRNDDGEDVDDDDDDDEEESSWWESLEDSHFGGGSEYHRGRNSTILDAEIL
jgi:hypothetical protein